MNIEQQPVVPSDEQQQIEVLERKIDAIFISVEKTRKYILGSLIITVVVIVLPIVGLVFAIPVLMDSVSSITATGLLEDM